MTPSLGRISRVIFRYLHCYLRYRLGSGAYVTVSMTLSEYYNIVFPWSSVHVRKPETVNPRSVSMQCVICPVNSIRPLFFKVLSDPASDSVSSPSPPQKSAMHLS